MFKIKEKEGTARNVAISPVTIGYLNLCYALFVAIVATPLTFIDGYNPIPLLITGGLTLYFVGRGIYMLRLRRKPVMKEVYPDSIVSRFIAGRGLKFAIVLAVIGTVLLVAVFIGVSYLFDDAEERSDIFSHLSFLIPLILIKETDNYLMEYFALCNYYNGKDTDRI